MQLHVYHKEEWKQEIKENKKDMEKINFALESKKYKLKEEIKHQLQWTYPNEFASKIPAKTSVSQLKQMNQQISEGEIDFLKLIKKDKVQQKIDQVPNFLKEEEEISHARRGSLIHLCIEHMNEKEEYNKEKLENLVLTLLQKKFITKKEAESISIKTLLAYTKSDLFKDLKQAKKVEKEQPFYYYMNANEIYQEKTKENILVQGVIDLYYINQQDHIILVDYKTDFVKQEEELIIKYRKQLEIYKRALEESLEKQVDEMYIYSVYLQKRIKVIL